MSAENADEDQWTGWPLTVFHERTRHLLVDVLERILPVLDDATIRPWVLVGGLGVQCWVSSSRVTGDVDLSLYDREKTARFIIRSVDDSGRQRNGVLLDGVKVDFLEAVDPAEHPDAPVDETFMRNLAWYETIRLRVDRTLLSADHRDGSPLIVPVARPGMLLSMKLAAVAATAPGVDQPRDPEKWGSDVHDIVTLVEVASAERLVRDLELADPRVRAQVRDRADDWLVAESSELAGRTRRTSDATVPEVAARRVEQCGFDLLDVLEA